MKKTLLIRLLALSVACASASTPATAAAATETSPYPHLLPPAAAVVRVLQHDPVVLAALSQVRAEEAERRRLTAGDYEWNLRLDAQRRRSQPQPGAAPEARFTEWNAELERPLRLPGKAADDAELGLSGLELADIRRSDALQETRQQLLGAWFLWLKEDASLRQWEALVGLLTKQADSARRRGQLGDAARVEMLQADAAQAQATAQAAQARMRRDNAAIDLARRFPGLPLDAPTAPSEQETPPSIDGAPHEWIERLVAHSSTLAVARAEARQARIMAARAEHERLPDPTVGLRASSERAGEERILGAYISIPLPGDGRRAASDGAQARVAAASHREAAVLRKVSAQAAALQQTVLATQTTWQASRSAAEQLTQAANMIARGYALGEGGLGEVLAARRLAHEALLAAGLAQLDAYEQHYRLLLDTHQLWVLPAAQ